MQKTAVRCGFPECKPVRLRACALCAQVESAECRMLTGRLTREIVRDDLLADNAKGDSTVFFCRLVCFCGEGKVPAE